MAFVCNLVSRVARRDVEKMLNDERRVESSMTVWRGYVVSVKDVGCFISVSLYLLSANVKFQCIIGSLQIGHIMCIRG